jgi:hypothetical protein
LNNIFEDGELDESSAVANFATTDSDGKNIKQISIIWMMRISY